MPADRAAWIRGVYQSFLDEPEMGLHRWLSWVEDGRSRPGETRPAAYGFGRVSSGRALDPRRATPQEPDDAEE